MAYHSGSIYPGKHRAGINWFLFHCLNYADDFAGAESSLARAQLSFDTLGNLLTEIGLAESKSKASAPATTMTYLGVSFNTVDMCLHVDADKMVELKSELIKWVRKTTAKKYELQSILGKLLWVSRTVRFSRIFVSRIIAETRKLSKQSDKSTLSRDIRKDFLWWLTFMEEFSGVEIIPATPVLVVYTFCPQCLGVAHTRPLVTSIPLGRAEAARCLKLHIFPNFGYDRELLEITICGQ